MMARFLFWYCSRLPLLVIKDQGQPYLERYFLGRCFGQTFYLHRFVGSDPDRGLHDHPWPWAWSIILSGWYFEDRRMYGDRLLIVRFFNFLRGDAFHRVILPSGVNQVWTLFAHRSVKAKEWGFLRPIPGEKHFRYVVASGGFSNTWWSFAPVGAVHPDRTGLSG